MAYNTDDAGLDAGGKECVANAWEAVRAQFHTRNFLCFIVVGLINNYHYCIVTSGSKAVADSFNLGNLMALITWASIAGNIVVRCTNTFVLMHWSYNKKYLVTIAQTLLGLVITSIAPFCGDIGGVKFAIFLVGVMFIGTGCSFGEQTSLGYLEAFPARTIGGWSTGTGMSGVVASLVFLGLDNTDLSKSVVFALQIPFVVFYFIAFYRGVYLVPREEVSVDANGAPVFKPLYNYERRWGNHILLDAEKETQRLLQDGGGADVADARPATTPPSPTDIDLEKYDNEANWSAFRRWVYNRAPAFPFEAVKRCNSVIAFQGVNLFLVYIFEYAIQLAAPNVFPDLDKFDDNSTAIEPGCATSKSDFDFFTQNAFVISQLAYQIGVLMSRSSLSVVRISRVEVLTVLQFVNFVCWLVLAKQEELQTRCNVETQKVYTWVWMVWMVFVGLMGGASYVNCFYNILNDAGVTAELTRIADMERRTEERRRAERVQRTGVKEMAPKACNARELAMNVGALYQTTGVMLGSLICLVLQNTLLKR